MAEAKTTYETRNIETFPSWSIFTTQITQLQRKKIQLVLTLEARCLFPKVVRLNIEVLEIKNKRIDRECFEIKNFKIIFDKENIHKDITLQKKKIVSRACCDNKPTIATIMTTKNCSENSEKSEIVCDEAENRESENVSGEIEKKGFR